MQSTLKSEESVSEESARAFVESTCAFHVFRVSNTQHCTQTVIQTRNLEQVEQVVRPPLSARQKNWLMSQE